MITEKGCRAEVATSAALNIEMESVTELANVVPAGAFPLADGLHATSN
jgi:hypothetical protein